MAGKKSNLTKTGSDSYKLSPEEARKGGINSGIARRDKKTMAEFAKIIGSSQVSDEDARAALAAAGVTDEEMTNSALVVFGVFRAAVQGDMKAVEKWQQLAEDFVQQTESTVHIVMDSDLDDLSG